MDTKEKGLQFNLTQEEFLDRLENPNDYPEEGDKKNSPGFNYLRLLLEEICKNLRKILDSDLSQDDWDETYKVSVSHPKKGQKYSDTIPSNGTELVTLNVAGELYKVPIIDAIDMAQTELEGLMEIHFEEDKQFQNNPDYKALNSCLEALLKISGE